MPALSHFATNTSHVRHAILSVSLAAGVAVLSGSTAVSAHNPAPEAVLYSFGGPNGAGPLSGVIADATGALYGTTDFGPSDPGNVFELVPHRSGYTEVELHEFHGADGSKPDGLTFGVGRSLYGSTEIGGAAGAGLVYRLTPHTHGYTEQILYNFRGGVDGNSPVGAPVLDPSGRVYGVTQFGGTSGNGVIFELVPSSSGYAEKVLWNFPGGAGGYLPQAGLTTGPDATVYGTTYYGGDPSCDGGCGTVFAFSTTQSNYGPSILYRFSNPSAGGFNPVAANNPFGVLTVDPHSGTIYGTTQYGGGCNGSCGTVFSLTPTPMGYAERTLHAFTGADGFAPLGQLLLGPHGVLYGSASLGGIGCAGIGCGTVFEMTPAGSGYTFTVIHYFDGPIDGADPESSGLTVDPAGALVGTTRSGGSDTNCGDGGPGGVAGCGTVFAIRP